MKLSNNDKDMEHIRIYSYSKTYLTLQTELSPYNQLTIIRLELIWSDLKTNTFISFRVV